MNIHIIHRRNLANLTSSQRIVKNSKHEIFVSFKTLPSLSFSLLLFLPPSLSSSLSFSLPLFLPPSFFSSLSFSLPPFLPSSLPTPSFKKEDHHHKSSTTPHHKQQETMAQSSLLVSIRFAVPGSAKIVRVGRPRDSHRL